MEGVADGLPVHRRYLVDQMSRAALSVYLNLLEGVGEFSPAEKARFYRMSARSLREVLGCLRVVIALQPELLAQVMEAGKLGNELRPKIIRYATYHAKRAHA